MYDHVWKDQWGGKINKIIKIPLSPLWVLFCPSNFAVPRTALYWTDLRCCPRDLPDPLA